MIKFQSSSSSRNGQRHTERERSRERETKKMIVKMAARNGIRPRRTLKQIGEEDWNKSKRPISYPHQTDKKEWKTKKKSRAKLYTRRFFLLSCYSVCVLCFFFCGSPLHLLREKRHGDRDKEILYDGCTAQHQWPHSLLRKT